MLRVVFIHTALTFLISVSFAQVSQSSVQSALLISLDGFSENSSSPSQRRSWSETTIDEKRIELGNEALLGTETQRQNSSFKATHGNLFPTNQELVSLLDEVFQNDVTLEDLQSAIEYLVNNDFGLTKDSLLSAIKSVILAYNSSLERNPNASALDSYDRIPYILLRAILPESQTLGGSGPALIRDLSQLTMEAVLEDKLSGDVVNQLSSAFSEEAFLLLKDPNSFFNDRNSLSIQEEDNIFPNFATSLEDPKDLLLEIGFKPGLSEIESDRLTESQEMDYGGLSGFEPDKTGVFQDLAIGLTQGYLNQKALKGNLTEQDFIQLTKGSEINAPNTKNNGSVEPSVISSVVGSLLDQIHASNLTATNTPGDNGISLYAYEILKSISNGFLLSSSVAASSSENYLDSGLHLKSAELMSRSLSQSAILHSTDNAESNEQEWIVNLLNAGRISESVAHGAAMGSQLAMVQPKSMDYGDNFEVFTNSRREIAKSVARGAANGAVNASSWLNSYSSENNDIETILTASEIEEVSRGAALGAMIGNTGLAVYYPTDQLVPIINFTAQGASYGSTSSTNLSDVKKDGTETIDVSITRESAIGSSMGAAFEPTVLLQLRPDTRTKDAQTISHLEAASFGSTFGAILGIQANSNPPTPNNKLGTGQDDRVIELKQAAKQGSIEGSLAGTQLALGLEDTSQESLQSKAEILKAINQSNANAAANSNQSSSLNSLRTSSRDMLLLMKKFGINPRFTNPAKIYKRPVVVQVDEPPIDDELEDAFKDASPL